MTDIEGKSDVELVLGLMRGDPLTFKQGYTLANALNAVARLRGYGDDPSRAIILTAILAEEVVHAMRQKR